MSTTMTGLHTLSEKLARGGIFDRADAETLLASADLVGIGMLADAARLARTGRTVTYGRVLAIAGGTTVDSRGEAKEVRVVGKPASMDEAVSWARAISEAARGAVLTGFSLPDLVGLAGHDHLVLAEFAGELAAAGLECVSDAPVDELGDADLAAEIIRAARHGGLAVERLIVGAASAPDRLDAIARARDIASVVGGIKAFAPLPRVDPPDRPSTGYDDVKTVAIARLWCVEIDRIQVDWPLYGPKLAQVALTFGAGDVDGVAAVDTLQLGHRRSPGEDITRQIRSAGGEPIERDGRFRAVP